ncbi:cytochrome P450, family 82, subfamily C, polypeptide 4 [Actinidia rufa]|uniref:Cytochrome P450, family 82, subfamily C, polypeptide 4 n=1 Tax=Actinidia rufa TaxID=165716 RepID=A0A7J0EKG2_9ERIC|nr:cytochrome P450, family 82, subfamily C, polypeptide 4 [Actinidia rufa]
MDSSFCLPVIGAFVTLVFVYCALVGKKNQKTSMISIKEAPQPAGAWPIIGHLHLLGGVDQLLYRTLGDMADKYGPAFNIRLGSRCAFVVNSWEVAKECFTDNDKALASRPTTAAAKLMGYNYAVFGLHRTALSGVRCGRLPPLSSSQTADLKCSNTCGLPKMVAGKRYFGAGADCTHPSGGSDTTAGTLTWAISLLLNNTEALKKAQEELDLHVGADRQVDDSDIKNLVYLQAIIKETLRLYPAGPLLGPREAMESCTVGGYNVPVGTRLIVNIWKIQRDPRVWTDPSVFKPERRSCPGVSFALQVLHLTLARLLHGFDLASPLDLPVDMSESPGLTIPKATPLEVLLTPRLAHEALRLLNCMI